MKEARFFFDAGGWPKGLSGRVHRECDADVKTGLFFR